MKKAIIFDLDNTLYDYDKVNKLAKEASYIEFNKYIKISKKKFEQLYNLSRAEIHRELSGTASAHNRSLYFQRLIEKTHLTIKPKLILKLYNTYWNTLLKNITLRQGVLETLKKIKERKLKIAIVSDLTTNIQLRKLEKLNISKYIDVLVTSEEAGSEKPHAIMFLLTLNKLNITPQEGIMIGDNTIADIEGANFVGLDTILLNKGFMTKKTNKDYRKPDFTIKDINKIIEIIDNINTKNVLIDGYIKFECHLKKTKPVKKESIKELNRYRNKLYKEKLIGAYPNKIGYGNISQKENDHFIITGSTTGNIKKLNNTHYSKVTKYNILQNKLFCTGSIKASSESMTHAAVYECDPTIKAVIHIHNLKMWEKYKNKLPTTPEYATYGTPEIAKEIQILYSKRNFKKTQIGVLGGHKEGLIAFGKNLKEVYNIIEKYHKK